MSIVERIMNNPEGGTISLSGADLPTTGYFVGGVVAPLVLSTPIEFTPDAAWDIEVFANYVDEYVSGADFLGWWTDEETGKLWIDATSWHGLYGQAERVTRERREIAFYDIELGRSFRPVYTREG